MQAIAWKDSCRRHSGMPKKPRSTDNPLGRKLLQVLAEQGHADDLVFLAGVFGVQVQSVYDWIDHGRLAKERFATLVQWSGRSLDWWFDVESPGEQAAHAPTAPLLPLAAALPAVMKAIAGLTAGRWQAVRSQFDMLNASPETLDDLVPEVLQQLVTAPPKHRRAG